MLPMFRQAQHNRDKLNMTESCQSELVEDGFQNVSSSLVAQHAKNTWHRRWIQRHKAAFLFWQIIPAEASKGKQWFVNVLILDYQGFKTPVVQACILLSHNGGRWRHLSRRSALAGALTGQRQFAMHPASWISCKEKRQR